MSEKCLAGWGNLPQKSKARDILIGNATQMLKVSSYVQENHNTQVSLNFSVTNSTPSNQITTQLLLTLNRLKERLEVSGAKARKVVSLDDLNKDSRAIHQVLSPRISSLHLLFL